MSWRIKPREINPSWSSHVGMLARKNVQAESGVDSLVEGDGLDEPLYLLTRHAPRSSEPRPSGECRPRPSAVALREKDVTGFKNILNQAYSSRPSDESQ